MLKKFQTKQGPQISVSNVRDIVFTDVQKLYRVWYNFWTIYDDFLFFLTR